MWEDECSSGDESLTHSGVAPFKVMRHFCRTSLLHLFEVESILSIPFNFQRSPLFVSVSRVRDDGEVLAVNDNDDGICVVSSGGHQSPSASGFEFNDSDESTDSASGTLPMIKA